VKKEVDPEVLILCVAIVLLLIMFSVGWWFVR
jgi:hypothetical protein